MSCQHYGRRKPKQPTNRCFLHRATHESVAMVVLLIAPLKESQSERHAHPGEESRHAQPENKATPRKGRSCGRVEAGDRWRRKFFEDHGTPPPGAHRCSLAVELDFVSGEGRPLLILVFCSWISFFGLPIKSYSGLRPLVYKNTHSKNLTRGLRPIELLGCKNTKNKIK